MKHKSLAIAQTFKALKKMVKPLPEPVVGVFARADDPYQVLVSCVISLRTKDATTAAASQRLFALAPDVQCLSKLSLTKIEKAIYPASFYRNKAKQLKAMAARIIEEFDAEVPATMDELLSLKGVGRKTANLTLILGHGRYGICVDTHVHRICNRLGWVKSKEADDTEMRLRQRLTKKQGMTINDLMVPFGQHICRPQSPFCSQCLLQDQCPKIGVKRSR